jgi:pyruvate-formate lyase-activating enzyme
MGGPQICFFPETLLDCCTYAVRSEGDEVLPRLIECLDSDGDVRDIPGISFLHDGHVVHTPDGAPPEIPATAPDITLIEGFERATKRFMGRRAIINTLQTTRGCRFRCKFCPTHKLFQGVYRNRDIDSIIADIKKRLPYSERFFVVDNDFCSDRKRSKALLQKIIEEILGVRFIIFERHEIGRDREMLELLRQAGVKVIIVGVESLLDESLKAFNKRQTHAEVLKSIRNIMDCGMHVLSTFVLGYDQDTPESAEEMIEFVTTNRLILNLFILHDLEHDASKELLIPLNRRFMTHYAKAAPDNLDFWDYMTGSFVTYFPKRMKPSTLQRLIFDVNDRAYSHGNILRDMFSRDLFRSFFGVAFGYRMKRINRNLRRYAEKGYIDYLERIEAGLYDDREELIEKKLASLTGLPLPPPVEGFVDAPFYRIHATMALIPALVRFALLKWHQRRLTPRAKASVAIRSA